MIRRTVILALAGLFQEAMFATARALEKAAKLEAERIRNVIEHHQDTAVLMTTADTPLDDDQNDSVADRLEKAEVWRDLSRFHQGMSSVHRAFSISDGTLYQFTA